MIFHTKVTAIALVALASAMLFTVLLLAGSDASAQQSSGGQTPDGTLTPTPVPTTNQGIASIVQDLPPLKGKINPPKYPKLGAFLSLIAERIKSGDTSVKELLAGAPMRRGVGVGVVIHLEKERANAIRAYLDSKEITPRNMGEDYIEVYLPPALLAVAAQRRGVKSIRPLSRLQPEQGVIVSKGVALHNADDWQDAGYRGQGIKVGVIDVGFEAFPELSGNGDTDEFPTAMHVRCVSYFGVTYQSWGPEDTTYCGSSWHGSMVTEIIYDFAPEATYYLAAVETAGDVSGAVDWMIEKDVDVINMSLGYKWDGPGDGTSPYSFSPLNSVNRAVSNGIVWVNSGGNYNDNYIWHGSFNDGDDDDRLNFSGDDECNEVTRDVGYQLQLRWGSDPDETGSIATDADLDMYLYEFTVDSEGEITYSESPVSSSESFESQADTLPLAEIIFPSHFLNKEGDVRYCVAVPLQSGSAPDWVQLYSRLKDRLEHASQSGAIINPAESANAGLLAVGAAPVSDPSVLEDFSSRGPTADGRTKPDLVSVDDLPSALPGYGTALGTSFAAPHVAGLAALVKQRFPSYTPAQIADYLRSNAEPRGGAAPNNAWGNGFAGLPASIPTITVTPTPSTTPTPAGSLASTPTPTPSPTATPMAYLLPDPATVNFRADGTEGHVFTVYTNQDRVFVNPRPEGAYRSSEYLRLSTIPSLGDVCSGNGYSWSVSASPGDRIYIWGCKAGTGKLRFTDLLINTFHTYAIAINAADYPSGTFTPTPTSTSTPIATATPSPTGTPTTTPSPTGTPTATATPSPTPTITPTPTYTATATATPTPTPTPISTSTPTATPTPTATGASVPGISLSASALTVREGRTARYTISLLSAPASDISVKPVSSDTSTVVPSPATLTFTPANWSDPQTVFVASPDDEIDNPDGRGATVSHLVGSAGSYSETAGSVSVSVTGDDDEAALLVVTDIIEQDFYLTHEIELRKMEGQSFSYWLALNSNPQSFVSDGSVTVALTTDSDRLTVSPSAVTFSASDGYWLDLYEKVTFTAVDNDLDEGNGLVRVSYEISGSPEYAALDIEDTLVTVVDDDHKETYDLTAIADPFTGAPSQSLTIGESDGAQRLLIEGSLHAGEEIETVQEVALTFGGTAVEGVDYTVEGRRYIKFGSGSVSPSTWLTITPVEDGVLEGDETIVITGKYVERENPLPGDGLADASLTITLTDAN